MYTVTIWFSLFANSYPSSEDMFLGIKREEKHNLNELLTTT